MSNVVCWHTKTAMSTSRENQQSPSYPSLLLPTQDLDLKWLTTCSRAWRVSQLQMTGQWRATTTTVLPSKRIIPQESIRWRVPDSWIESFCSCEILCIRYLPMPITCTNTIMVCQITPCVPRCLFGTIGVTTTSKTRSACGESIWSIGWITTVPWRGRELSFPMSVSRITRWDPSKHLVLLHFWGGARVWKLSAPRSCLACGTKLSITTMVGEWRNWRRWGERTGSEEPKDWMTLPSTFMVTRKIIS